jgi:hypothetical protein
MYDLEETEGVLVGRGSYFVRLKRLGVPYGDGHFTSVLIKAHAGPFQANLRDDSFDNFKAFHSQLNAIYENLSGSAELDSYEKFNLTMTARRGDVNVCVKLADSGVQQSKLSFEFLIDQSFLPKIIGDFKSEFLNGEKPTLI